MPKRPSAQAAAGRRGTTRAARSVRMVPKITRKVFEKFGFSTATLLTDWAVIVGADLAALHRARAAEMAARLRGCGHGRGGGRPAGRDADAAGRARPRARRPIQGAAADRPHQRLFRLSRGRRDPHHPGAAASRPAPHADSPARCLAAGTPPSLPCTPSLTTHCERRWPTLEASIRAENAARKR